MAFRDRLLNFGQRVLDFFAGAARDAAERLEVRREPPRPNELGQTRRQIQRTRRGSARRLRERQRAQRRPPPPPPAPPPSRGIFEERDEFPLGNPDMVRPGNERDNLTFPTLALAQAAYDSMIDAGVMGGPFGYMAIDYRPRRKLPFVLYVGRSV